MRAPAPTSQGARVRLLLELDGDADGRVTGLIGPVDGPASPFSGWLELLRLLEGCIGQDGASAPWLDAGHPQGEQPWDRG